MKPAQDSVEMLDFPGLMLNVDPRDYPPGAAEEQENIACILMGELTVRRGMKEVVFEG